jgi:chemotaxis receptor (MCP) glutamine deamidase CheD
MAGVNVLTSKEAAQAVIPVLRVAPDRLEATQLDRVLVARLDATMALCFYDAVEEPGALLHLRISPPRRTPASDLTDSVLTGDLMLLEQTMKALQQIAPSARYWQCKMVAQLPDDDETLGNAAACVAEFVRAYLSDSVVRLVDTQVRFGGAAELLFRPAMGELRIHPVI